MGDQADLALEDRRRAARARVRVGGLPPRRSGPRDRRADARPDHRRRRCDDDDRVAGRGRPRSSRPRSRSSHCAGLDGAGQLGDGKARLAAARALILAGELDDAIDHIQITQLRRSQSRLEAEINRLFAARRDPARRRMGARDRAAARARRKRLAQLAARDLADCVPGMNTLIVRARARRAQADHARPHGCRI